jgi:hypothetical protein
VLALVLNQFRSNSLLLLVQYLLPVLLMVSECLSELEVVVVLEFVLLFLLLLLQALPVLGLLSF